MNVLLIDEDSDFRDRFSTYIAGSLNDVVLTSVPDLKDADAAADADVILVDSEADAVDDLKRAGMEKRTVVFTAEDRGGPSVRSDGVRCVFKYQRASSIVSSVAELADAAAPVPFLRTAGEMEVVSVSGFSGGCGRTVFSIMYARLLKRMLGRSSVILSVERVGDINDYFRRPQGKSDSNLFLLNFASGLKLAPRRFITEDDYGASVFIMPEQAMSDVTDLSRADVERLIGVISGWGLFDTLIVDLNPQADEVCRAFLGRADRVFMLHDHRRSACHCERIWNENMAALCRTGITHIVNMALTDRETGEIFYDEQSQSESLYGAAYRIPYDPDSFFIRDGLADISMVGSFSRSVEGIIERI